MYQIAITTSTGKNDDSILTTVTSTNNAPHIRTPTTNRNNFSMKDACMNVSKACLMLDIF